MRGLFGFLTSLSESQGYVENVKRVLILLVTCLLVAGCGGSKSAAPTPTAAAPTTPASTPTTTQSPPNALQGEAKAAATGDIPDNQVYVVFTNTRAGYSIRYPEGWAQSGSSDRVTIYDKNNLVRTVVRPGSEPTLGEVSAELQALKATTPSLRFQSPQRVQISGRPAIKVVYTTESPPNPVTNKSVQLTVDRYYLAQGGKRAVIDLGTPVGVDNVDGYRLMVQSFRWK